MGRGIPLLRPTSFVASGYSIPCSFGQVSLSALLYTTVLSCASAKRKPTCCSDTKVKVFSNGTCFWFREFRLSVSHCDISIVWFPFDIQVCDLIYESKSFDINHMNITRMLPSLQLDSYSSDGEWDLLGIKLLHPLHLAALNCS